MGSILRSVSLLALASCALAAQASDLTLTLSSPYAFTLPTSGTQVFAVTGTLTSTSHQALSVYADTNVAGPGGTVVPHTVPFSAINSAIQATGTYTGTIVAVTFSSTNPAGAYSGGISFGDPSGNTGTMVTPFTINVSAQPTPEPASLAALGLGAVALLRRRVKAEGLP